MKLLYTRKVQLSCHVINDQPAVGGPVSQEGLPRGSPGYFDRRFLGAFNVEDAKFIAVREADAISIMIEQLTYHVRCEPVNLLHRSKLLY